MTTRRLAVLRHAHSDQVPGVADEDRELSERGIRDARRAAAELDPPDHVVCSTALRARQTWQQLDPLLPARPSVHYDPQVYSATVDTLFDLVRATGDEVGTLLLVGHNPTVHQFCHALLAERAPVSFPAAAFVVLDVTGSWSDVDSTRAGLAHTWTPG